MYELFIFDDFVEDNDFHEIYHERCPSVAKER
jgi:hypothetical protein